MFIQTIIQHTLERDSQQQRKYHARFKARVRELEMRGFEPTGLILEQVSYTLAILAPITFIAMALGEQVRFRAFHYSVGMLLLVSEDRRAFAYLNHAGTTVYRRFQNGTILVRSTTIMGKSSKQLLVEEKLPSIQALLEVENLQQLRSIHGEEVKFHSPQHAVECLRAHVELIGSKFFYMFLFEGLVFWGLLIFSMV